MDEPPRVQFTIIIIGINNVVASQQIYDLTTGVSISILISINFVNQFRRRSRVYRDPLSTSDLKFIKRYDLYPTLKALKKFAVSIYNNFNRKYIETKRIETPVTETRVLRVKPTAARLVLVVLGPTRRSNIITARRKSSSLAIEFGRVSRRYFDDI